MRSSSRVVGLGQGKDVKEIGEAAIPFAQHTVRLGRHLGDQTHLAPLDERLEDVGHAQGGLRGVAGGIEAEEVVEVENVVALAGDLENGQASAAPTGPRKTCPR